MLGCCGQREIKVKSGVLTHFAYIYLILARGRCPNRARATLDPGAVFRATAAAVGLLCCENGPRWRVEPYGTYANPTCVHHISSFLYATLTERQGTDVIVDCREVRGARIHANHHVVQAEQESLMLNEHTMNNHPNSSMLPTHPYESFAHKGDGDHSL